MTTNDFFKDTVFSASNPLALMVCAVIVGVLFGVFKDLMKIPERLFGKNAVLIFVSDFIGIVFAYLFMFVCALNFNHGIIRWYHFVMSFFALFVYKNTLSSAVVLVLDRLCCLVGRVAGLIIKIIIYPVNLIKKVLEAFYNKTSVMISCYIRKRRYEKKRIKYYKSASKGFGLLPYKKGEKKNNVKKTCRRSNTSHNRPFDSCGIQASDGA